MPGARDLTLYLRRGADFKWISVRIGLRHCNEFLTCPHTSPPRISDVTLGADDVMWSPDAAEDVTQRECLLL